MDASSQPKRKRKPLDPKLGAIILGAMGIFKVVNDGPDVFVYLLQDTGLTSLLAELMVLWAALLWLGLMVLLARYAKRLLQAVFWLLVIVFFGVVIYFFATWGSSDEMREVIWQVSFGLTTLTGAPYLWFLYKPAEQAAPMS